MMDEFLSDIYGAIFKKYILYYTLPEFDIAVNEKDKDEIIIKGKNCIGHVSFNKYNIMELTVINQKNNQCDFYLHFQMKDLRHAKELFEEMCECMRALLQIKKEKILLCCSSGLTTGFFADKLNEMAQLLNIDYEFCATRFSSVYEEGKEYNMIFLAPQVSHQDLKLKRIFYLKKIIRIPPHIFARYDCIKMFELIKEVQNAKPFIPNMSIKPVIQLSINQPVLCLAINYTYENVQIDYRISGQYQRIIYENKIIKKKLSLDDIKDTLDTLLTNYSDIDTIGISIPGIVKQGRVYNSVVDGIKDINLQEYLRNVYKKRVIISSDIQSAAIGYASTQRKSKKFSLIYFSDASNYSVAHMIDNCLINSYQNYIEKEQLFLMNNDQIDHSSQDAFELLFELLLTMIALMPLDVYIISCPFLIDLDILKERVLNVIKKEISDFNFEIQKIEYIKEYILMGILRQCVY